MKDSPLEAKARKILDKEYGPILYKCAEQISKLFEKYVELKDKDLGAQLVLGLCEGVIGFSAQCSADMISYSGMESVIKAHMHFIKAFDQTFRAGIKEREDIECDCAECVAGRKHKAKAN